jgi:low affinity Fe/Cu permease
MKAARQAAGSPETRRRSPVRDAFHWFAHRTAELVGSPWSFVVAVLVVIVWAASGKIFGYSDTWQLVINTGTTIVTFLIVFLIQATQNRDSLAIHLKLDEIIRSLRRARNRLVDIEEMTDEELQELQQEFRRLQEREKHRGRST